MLMRLIISAAVAATHVVLCFCFEIYRSFVAGAPAALWMYLTDFIAGKRRGYMDAFATIRAGEVWGTWLVGALFGLMTYFIVRRFQAR